MHLYYNIVPLFNGKYTVTIFHLEKKIIYMLMVSTIFKRLACTLVCQVNKKRGHKIISTKWWSTVAEDPMWQGVAAAIPWPK